MNTICRLAVPRPDLEEAFRLVRKLCRPKHGEEAVLSFGGACLHIDCAGMTLMPGAQGDWPGQVRFPARFLLMLARLPPAGDPIEFSVKQGCLHVGSCSVSCTLQPVWSKSIDLPMNTDLAEILALPLTYTPEEIAASGYSRVVDRVRFLADRRLARAARELKCFRVEPVELREWAYATLRRKTAEDAAPFGCTSAVAV